MTAPSDSLAKIAALKARIRSLATRKPISISGLLLIGLSLAVSSLIFLPNAFTNSGSLTQYNSGLISCVIGIIAILVVVAVAFYSYQPSLSLAEIENQIDRAVREVEALVAAQQLDRAILADFKSEAGSALYDAAEKHNDTAVQIRIARKYAVPVRA